MADRQVVTTAAEIAAALVAAPVTLPEDATLAALPEPAIVEALDYSAAVDARVLAYADRVEAAGLPRPDILSLVSTPERVILEETVYLETLLRGRVNAVYRASLLYFADGADLDHVAETYGVERLTGEPDADLRRRVRIANRGRSAAGPADWYRSHALAADEGVEDVAVTRPTFPVPGPEEVRGRLVISVLAEGVTGEPTQAQLDAVAARLTSPAVRSAATEVVVQAATRATVDIAADIWLETDADASVVDGLAPTLGAAWAQARGLGWDVRESWIHAQLMQPGVARVELPGWSDVVSAADAAPLLGTVTLTHREG